jgi:hypothetical protein
MKVKGLVFSKFLEDEVPNFRNEFNILKINIEGAEWDFFNDIIAKEYHKFFLFCGQGHDVDKVSELDSNVYWNLINNNKIKLYRFSDFKPHENSDMQKIIKDYVFK